MGKAQLDILFLGENGFPVGFGAIHRQMLMAKGLVKERCKVTVISAKGTLKKGHPLSPKGEFEGIEYEFTSGAVYKSTSFFERNWLKLKGKVNELRKIAQLRRAGKVDGCVVSTMDFDNLVLYWIWLKIWRLPMILNLCELNSSMASRTGWRLKINDYLFDRFAPVLCDGVCPISEYLIHRVERYAPGKPLIKMPILCDFQKFDLHIKRSKEVKFLYCGAASYRQLIQFIMQSFEKLKIEKRPVYLDFILGGSDDEINAVKSLIATSDKSNQIRLYTNIPHQEIPKYYAEASALLIPLRPTLQDEARFPHKLGEYLASGSPVITT
ncbi:MAG: glycosyltransferase, partial [Bacteroidota bacterium]